jgi:hypothetical protein
MLPIVSQSASTQVININCLVFFDESPSARPYIIRAIRSRSRVLVAGLVRRADPPTDVQYKEGIASTRRHPIKLDRARLHWAEFVSFSGCERNPLVTRGVLFTRDSETFRRKNSGSETNPMGCPRTPSDLLRNRDFDERARNRKIAVKTGEKKKNAERVTLGVLC